MAGGTPLTATDRIVLTYVVNGLVHKRFMYCKQGTPIVSVPQVLDRGGLSIAFPDAAQGAWNIARKVFASGVPAAAALLQTRTGTFWNPVASAVLTGAGSDSNDTFEASQLTLVVRDTNFLKIRVVYLETAEGYLTHSADGCGADAALDAFTNGYNGDAFGANEPYMWEKSRGDNYILQFGSVAGLTFDLNDKVKRARHQE